jgi:hypothetical protein
MKKIVTKAYASCAFIDVHGGKFQPLVGVITALISYKTKNAPHFHERRKKTGCLVVQISSKFIADLKRLAELPKKIKKYDELLKDHDWGFCSDS